MCFLRPASDRELSHSLFVVAAVATLNLLGTGGVYVEGLKLTLSFPPLRKSCWGGGRTSEEDRKKRCDGES